MKGETVSRNALAIGGAIKSPKGREVVLQPLCVALNGAVGTDEKIRTAIDRGIGGQSKRKDRSKIIEGEVSILPTLEVEKVVFMEQAHTVVQVIVLKGDPGLSGAEVSHKKTVVGGLVNVDLIARGVHEAPEIGAELTRCGVDCGKLLDIGGVIDATKLSDGVAQFKNMLSDKAKALGDGHIGCTVGQARIGAATVGAVWKVPIGVPEKRGDGVNDAVTLELVAWNGGAIVAAVSALDGIPAKVGNGIGAGGGGALAGGIMGTALHDSIGVIEGNLHFSSGVIGIDGIAVVDARAAVVGQAIENDRAAPVTPNAHFEVIIGIIEIVIGEAVDGCGFRLH